MLRSIETEGTLSFTLAKNGSRRRGMEIEFLTREMLPALSDFANANFDRDAGKFTPEILEWHFFHDSHVRPEFCLVGLERERIIACALGVARGAHAWVKLFGVEQTRRRKGIATLLFSRIEQTFLEAGARRVHIGNAVPLYLMPGVNPQYTEAYCFLQARGYHRNSDAVNMVVDLNAEDFDTSEDEQRLERQDGVLIRRVTIHEREAFSAWMREIWSEGWQEEALLSMEHEPPTTFVALRDGKYVGFATYDVELFHRSLGPMGVLPEMRGRRLGAVLARRCLRAMKERGDSTCEIAWVGPVGFYARVAHARISTLFYHLTKSFGV